MLTIAPHPEVADALAAGRPVVALESTLLAHGLPRPENLTTGRDLESILRAEGAVPATVAVLDGVARIGLTGTELERVCAEPELAKLSIRDLPVAAAGGGSGATTVASTSRLASLAGIEVFATGGLGGVHRGAQDSFDESADLTALSSTRIIVVCAGVKSILDVAATLERLDTLSVPVLGYRSRCFPGFYLRDSGFELDWQADSVEQIAAAFAAGDGILPAGLVVTNPLPEDDQLDPVEHNRLIGEALVAAERAGVTGKAVTPFVLDHLHRNSDGRTRAVNVTLVRRNTELAARIAGALAAVRRDG